MDVGKNDSFAKSKSCLLVGGAKAPSRQGVKVATRRLILVALATLSRRRSVRNSANKQKEYIRPRMYAAKIQIERQQG